MSEEQKESLYEEANEMLLNDEFEKAIKLFSRAIELNNNAVASFAYNCFIGRAQAHLKLKNFDEVLNDAQQALDLDKNDSRAYHKKGLALFNLKEYEKSLAALEEGENLADTPSKKGLFTEWINKSKAHIPVKAEVSKEVVEVQEEVKPIAIPPPVIKHEWYQSESQVTVSILAKHITSNDVTIDSKENTLCIQSNNPESLKIDFFFNLEHQIQPENTQIKFMTNKIEIKLKKCEPIQWKKLNITSSELASRLKIQEKKPEYPTSSKKPKNWDKIAADIAAEEKDEKLEGDAALNKLFRDVYANGTDETRKAMNKSFVESGGTTLSTNWGDVGAKKLDVKPPDGMEWKTWSS